MTTHGRKFRLAVLIPVVLSTLLSAQTVKNGRQSMQKTAQASTPMIDRARRHRIGGGLENGA